MQSLIVRTAFGPYPAGALIEDPEEVAAVLAGESSGNVVIVANHELAPAPTQEG